MQQLQNQAGQQTTAQQAQQVQQAAQQQQEKTKATVPMWMCSKIMHIQREIHPTILSSLEGIVDQVNKHLED